MATLRTMVVQSITGRSLLVVDIPPGLYGAFPSAASSERQVEFYDRTHQHTLYGQFTGGRYYASTLLTPGRADQVGLALNGTLTAWMISPSEYRRVIEWLKSN